MLRNGGWLFTDQVGRTDWHFWWYGWLTQTYTWAGAQNWSQFASLRTTHLSSVWSMAIADVLQVDLNKDGSKDHTMLMTKWASTELYMTYHTNNTLNRSLSSIISANPSAAYYAYRT